MRLLELTHSGQDGRHRGKIFTHLVMDETNGTFSKNIDGIAYCVLAQNGKWLIAVQNIAQEPSYPDLGSFDTWTQAVLQLKLLGS